MCSAVMVHGSFPAYAATTCRENSHMARRTSRKSTDINALVKRAVTKALRTAVPKDATNETRRAARVAFSMGFASGFDAGYDAAEKAAVLIKPAIAAATDPDDMLATLVITKKTGRATGGTWVKGTIAGHGFEALVFPEHAESAAFELGDSRISKLWLRDNATKAEAACFDRGWDTKPMTPAAKAIVDLLAAGLAETVFGK